MVRYDDPGSKGGRLPLLLLLWALVVLLHISVTFVYWSGAVARLQGIGWNALSGALFVAPLLASIIIGAILIRRNGWRSYVVPLGLVALQFALMVVRLYLSSGF